MLNAPAEMLISRNPRKNKNVQHGKRWKSFKEEESRAIFGCRNTPESHILISHSLFFSLLSLFVLPLDDCELRDDG